MDDNLNVTYSRSHLESLSTGELVELAESIDIDIPPGLERIFIIEELLENFSTNDTETREEIGINPSYSESVQLPKQYNISFVDVMIRDPLWVYVFWEIKGHDREAYENAYDFKGYILRVVPLDKGETIPKSKDNSYMVTISTEDSSRYLGFTEQSTEKSSNEGNRYIVMIGAVRGDTEHQIAISTPFCLPRLVENNDAFPDQNPLLRLSGIQDFTTIRTTDHLSNNTRQ